MERRPPDNRGDAYPKRPAFFAMRVLRLMAKSCAAQRIGPEACWLITVVAMLEDRTGYRRPISFYNEQLAPILGSSVDRLERARQKAVAEGWLFYRRGAKGRAALYWAEIPSDLADTTDTTIDESCDEFLRNSRKKPADKPQILPQFAEESIPQTDNSSAICGGIPEESPRNPRNYLPSTNNQYSSCPNSPSPDEASDENGRRKPQPSPEDFATARWLWAKIQSMQPTRKSPNLAAWAATIRLMRTRDHRSTADIRATFAAAHVDSFWGKQILSPDNLRRHYDNLRLKLGLDTPGQNVKATAPIRDLDPATEAVLDEIDRIKATRR